MVVGRTIGTCGIEATSGIGVGAEGGKLLGPREGVEMEEVLPASLLLCLAVVFVSELVANRDKLVWGLTTDGMFFVRSAYASLVDITSESGWSEWKLIWKLKQRVKVFFWLLSPDRLLTNYACSRRFIAKSLACSTCDSLKEDTLHSLRYCFAARDIWLLLVP